MSEELIPHQHTGGESNTEAHKRFDDENSASAFYEEVKQRLLNVNSWHQWAGKGSATFQLTDPQGNTVQRSAQEGDHFKIDIPGPGTQTGEGYDWVQIEKIEEERGEGESITIKVRPTTNPNNAKEDVAHFFADDATSSFQVRREGTKVIAAVYGRNEKPNTKAEGVMDKIRNVAIAAGAISGGSKLQWKSLVEGLVSNA